MSMCPKCGYVLAPYERLCPRCAQAKREGAPPERQAAPPAAQERGLRGSVWLGVGAGALAVIIIWLAAAAWKGWLPFFGRRAAETTSSSVESEAGPEQGGEASEEDAAEAALRELLWECPFELQVGAPVRVASWWQGWEMGIEDATAVPEADGAQATARVLFVDDWTITGVRGDLLRMPTQNIRGRLLEGSATCTKTWGENGELTLGGSIGAGARYVPDTSSGPAAQTMFADEVSSLVYPELYVRLLWQDQPFELYQGGELVATFESAEQYSAMRR